MRRAFCRYWWYTSFPFFFFFFCLFSVLSFFVCVFRPSVRLRPSSHPECEREKDADVQTKNNNCETFDINLKSRSTNEFVILFHLLKKIYSSFENEMLLLHARLFAKRFANFSTKHAKNLVLLCHIF